MLRRIALKEIAQAQHLTLQFQIFFIGLVGFEPTASWSRTRRSTKLSHSPNSFSELTPSAHYLVHFSADGKR
jgi:hypothetical protein